MRILGSVEPLAVDAPEEEPFETGIHRIGASVHALGGSLFVAGGLGEARGPESDVLEYILSAGSAARRWPLHTPRYLHASVAVSPSRILLIGGLTDTGEGLCATAAAERLDLEQGTSERLPDLPFATAEPQIARLSDGRILVMGGYDDDGLVTRTALLDTDAGAWHSLAPLPSPRAGATPIVLADRVLLVGGMSTFGEPSAPSILISDPPLSSWTERPLEIPVGAAITPMEQGTFLVVGGRAPDGSPLADVTLWTTESP